MKRWVPFAVVALALTACQDSSGPEAKLASVAPKAALIAARSPIPGSYIVVMKDAVANIDGEIDQIGQSYGTSASYRYRSAVKGFAGKLSLAAVEALRKDPRIAYIEQDQTMSTNTTQAGATWGIDRIDQRTLPLSTTYVYNADGTGVTVYIIDTGINFTHTEYNGRAFTGIDEVTSGGTAADCNGHGSHVSGTVGGTTYGVAKRVKLVAVRVLDCSGSGTTAGVIAGIDWVTAQKRAAPSVPSAANMSLGGGLSTTLNQAVENSVAAGVVYAIAAGNSSADACTFSPASAPNAITVGATDINDGFASFSNRGSCVDINAPGVNITSAWMGSTTATNTISGTSMATPHVAGTIALYLQVNPTATAAQVDAALKANASTTSVPSGTTNKFLYSGFITASTTPVISLSPSSFSFNGSVSGPNPASQNLSITNSGVGTLNWTATVSSATTWLSVTPTGGTAPSTAVVSVNTAGMTAGSYSGTITVSASGATDKVATVTLTIASPPTTAPSLISPTTGATNVAIPASLSWSSVTGATAYLVQVSAGTSVGPTYVYNQSVTGTSTSVSGLSPNSTYAWNVTATNSAGSGPSSATGTFTTAAAPLTTVTISPATASIAVNATVTLRATTNPTGRAVTWTSSNTTVATVSTTGVVTGRATGSATITATAADGGKGTATVTVTAGCTNGNCQN